MQEPGRALFFQPLFGPIAVRAALGCVKSLVEDVRVGKAVRSSVGYGSRRVAGYLPPVSGFILF